MIRLSEADRDAIRAHGARDFPYECCGVILGDVENGVIKGQGTVRNLDESCCDCWKAPSADIEAACGEIGANQ